MSKPPPVPIRSRWQARGTNRVFVVLERLPFGRLLIQEEGRAYTGETQQRALLAKFERLPDAQGQAA